jgi:hypothetical protein
VSAAGATNGAEFRYWRRPMKQFEFKTVVYSPGIAKRLTGNDFGEDFLGVLSEHGREGWDLKAVVRENGMQALLIFSRALEDNKV